MAERLEARAPEIAEAVLERLHGMERVDPIRDVGYLEALDGAVHQGVLYWIDVLAVGEERAGDVPLPVITQARVAARHRIPLETALRRYTAAKEHLTDFVCEEVAAIEADDPSLIRTAIAAQRAAFERLLVTATEEYRQEVRSRARSHEAHRVERVERLLAGERVDPSLLEYELDGHHLGLFARSAKARPLVRRLASEFGRSRLILAPSSEELWAWLGSSRAPLDPKVVRDWIAREGSPDLPIAIGEPKSAWRGWRLTHEQARSALWIARAREAPVVEYAEVAMLASIRRDQLTMTTLRERYILPLANARNGGDLRVTLRAYFKCGRSSTDAATALGVSRQAVIARIKRAEECLEERLIDCEDALSAALTLEELGCFPNPPHSRP